MEIKQSVGIKICFHIDLAQFSKEVTDFKNEINVTKTYNKTLKSQYGNWNWKTIVQKSKLESNKM